MAQFDVYRNANQSTSELFPFLLDVQNDLLGRLPTRVIVPLSRASNLSWDLSQLNPVFEVAGEKVFMSTADLASMFERNLGEKVVSLQDQRDEILKAVDFLFCGY